MVFSGELLTHFPLNQPPESHLQDQEAFLICANFLLFLHPPPCALYNENNACLAHSRSKIYASPVISLPKKLSFHDKFHTRTRITSLKTLHKHCDHKKKSRKNRYGRRRRRRSSSEFAKRKKNDFLCSIQQ